MTVPPGSLTHLDSAGRARMVDVGAKPDTQREAIARAELVMDPATLELVIAQQKGSRVDERPGTPNGESAGQALSKGDVLGVAQVAGIMAAKQTSELIPLCHPLPLTSATLRFDWDRAQSRLLLEAEVRTTGKTGVEMEALTAVSVAGLTVYDMCKAVDRGMRLERVRLVRKSGGRSGVFESS
ncbi:MAG: cyclic pyranopterin monophosphate synthase MoaC [Dehalococcoidia bacterium]|nr:cyclic pyranopterin monophosphate synthase MoaC [Dehalococcoidia bacterium]